MRQNTHFTKRKMRLRVPWNAFLSESRARCVGCSGGLIWGELLWIKRVRDLWFYSPARLTLAPWAYEWNLYKFLRPRAYFRKALNLKFQRGMNLLKCAGCFVGSLTAARLDLLTFEEIFFFFLLRLGMVTWEIKICKLYNNVYCC